MPVIMIYASPGDCIFGNKGSLPWNNQEDIELFKELTLNHTVIMGHGTWHSLGNCALPSRKNIVLARKKVRGRPDAVYSSISELKIDPKKKNFFIGGRELFESLLHSSIKIDEVYVSRIKGKYEGDVSFYNFGYFSIYETKSFETFDFLKYAPDPKSKQNEEQYLLLLNKILQTGIEQPDRTGTGTLAIFGAQLNFNIRQNFPLLTTKKMAWKSIQEELFFFLRGSTNTKELEEKGVNIWRGNTSREFLNRRGLNYEEGEMGPMYGYQWRNFGGSGLDQIEKVIKEIRRDPFSRRLMITTFNPADVEKGVLWPCHGIVLQFFCKQEEEKMYISALMYQRSADAFLGLPFNIASYALLLHIIAREVNMFPDELIIQIGNAHLYKNHVRQAKIQLERDILIPPKLEVYGSGIETKNIKLWGYFHWPHIFAEICV